MEQRYITHSLLESGFMKDFQHAGAYEEFRFVFHKWYQFLLKCVILIFAPVDEFLY